MSVQVLVGITQRVDCINSYGEYRDALDQRLVDWVLDMGFLPVPIPNSLINLEEAPNIESQPVLQNWLQVIGIHSLILSGGNDLGDSQHRDITESVLLSWAKDHQIPVLGLCRGMQMMGTWAGSDLVAVKDHVRVRHNLKITTQSGEWFQDINSYHNLALANCPVNFRIIANSDDGSIEAIEHKSLPWMAWMWHPEREEEYSLNDQSQFKRLLRHE